MKHFGTILIAATIVFAGPAFAAAAAHDHDHMALAAKDEKTATHSGTGVVRKVDAAAGKVTVHHEPIASIGWPAMTMAFDVKDKSLLRDVKPGQKVEFTFAQEGTRYVIGSIK